MSNPVDPINEHWRDRKKKCNNFPAAYRPMYRRAMTGKHRRDAIRAHCIECMGYSPCLVDGCTAPACPLFPYRNGVAGEAQTPP